MIRALMIPVEKAVRPVVAQHTRKLRMREELYSLIEERYQSFLTAGCMEEDAQQKAIAAFGDPQSIYLGLQSTVPRWELFSTGVDRFLFQEFQSPTFKQALRSGGLLGTVFAFWLVGVALVLAAVTDAATAISLIPLFLTLSLVFGLNTAVFHWFGCRAIADWQAHRWNPLFGKALAVGLTVSLSAIAIDLTASWDFFCRDGWPVALSLFPFATGLFYAICWLLAIEVAHRQSWETIELE